MNPFAKGQKCKMCRQEVSQQNVEVQMTLSASIFILYVCIMSMNNVNVSKLCMDDCMADKSSVYCLRPNVVSCYKSRGNNG